MPSSRGRPCQARPAHDLATRLTGDLQTAWARIRIPATPMAFYGRTAHAAGTWGSQADRSLQLVLPRAVIAACDGQIGNELFDEDCRADRPWSSRPQGNALLDVLSASARLATALVATSPWHLLPRCASADGTWILRQFALRRVSLVLADTGVPALAAGDYDLLGRLMPGPAGSTRPDGRASWPSARGRRTRSTRHTGSTQTGKPGRGEPG